MFVEAVIFRNTNTAGLDSPQGRHKMRDFRFPQSVVRVFMQDFDRVSYAILKENCCPPKRFSFSRLSRKPILELFVTFHLWISTVISRVSSQDFDTGALA